jgi:hypothetical protein
MKHKNLTKQIVKLNRNQEMGSRRDFPKKKGNKQTSKTHEEEETNLAPIHCVQCGMKAESHVSARAYHPDTWRSIMISTRWDQVHTEKRNGSEDKLRSIMISCQVQKKKEWVRR